jgi:hypothetical protein
MPPGCGKAAWCFRVSILDDEALELSASVHIAAQRVRLCGDVLSKQFPLTFLQGAAVAGDADPLRLAFAAGIALALDPGRSLGRAAG